jgi:plasmid stabilization system protein ParE
MILNGGEAVSVTAIMRVRYTDTAIEEIERILSHIAAQNRAIWTHHRGRPRGPSKDHRRRRILLN